MTVSTKDIRNVIFISHAGVGKTTLVENLLLKGGTISKTGNVSEGTTVSDYNDDEKSRKNSINLSMASYEKAGVKVNLFDAPGFLDYIGEAVSGINAADAAVLMVHAVGGIQVGTTKFWKRVQKAGLPCMIVINKMDKDNANFTKVLEDIQKRFGKKCVALCYPNGTGATFSGMANLLTKEGIDKLEGDDKTNADLLSSDMVEGVAESDDQLLEKYLEEGELSPEDLNKAFRTGVISGKIIPVIPMSAEKGVGVEAIMSFIQKYLPSPEDRGAVEAETLQGDSTVTLEPKSDGAFVAKVFKTISDPYAGQISIFRVMSGTARGNQAIRDTTSGSSEKFGQLVFLKGKDQIQTGSVVAGDIAAVSKLKDVHTGDTLSDDKNQVKLVPVVFPEPAISYSITPKSRSDEDKISSVLGKLVEEDPTFQLLLDEETHEIVVSGMGEMHIKTMLERMKTRYGVEVVVGTPKVAYRETIADKGDSKYRHKKQSGGAGQFAEVWMRVEPLERGKGFEFVDEVVGGAIPKQLVGSCEKGVVSAMKNGTIAGYPVTDVKVIVYDGKTHPVDSKDIAFQIAAAHAFRESFEKAKPSLLEPVMNIELTVPEENMGDIAGSLSSRRGRVQGMDSEGGMQIVRAQIPLEEMYKYANELKSLTAGRATYTMMFSHYDIVPGNVAQKIASESTKKKGVEE
ncbi:MAG: elongation factor G [Candidatus Omnitrophica bacterium]|nr:elongation factor G [Candidatus Omnitrophota bacterium]